MTIDEIKGKRVKVVSKKHPHFDEVGTIEDYKMTGLGKPGLVIKVDEWTSFFVFDMAEIRFV